MKVNSEYLTLSSLKMSENGQGMIVRVFNLSDKEITINTIFNVDECSYSNLLEKLFKYAEFSRNKIKIKVKGNEIVTLLIKWGEKNE